MPRVAAAVSTFDTDLLGLGEYEWARAGELRPQLKTQFPFSAVFPNSTDVALFSRHPITEKRLIRYPDMRSPFLRAVVDFDGTSITVYVVHLTSPDIIGLPWAYDASERDRELQFLLDRLAEETGPLLLLGDCNFSDQSDAHRAMEGLLADTCKEAGRGMGFTYPNGRRLLPPLVRIDYIWHSDHFVVYNARVLDDNGASDHRPVSAQLALRTSDQDGNQLDDQEFD